MIQSIAHRRNGSPEQLRTICGEKGKTFKTRSCGARAADGHRTRARDLFQL